MTAHVRITSHTSNDEDEAIVSGWEQAMNEVVENEYSEHVERRISFAADDGLAEIAALSRSGSVELGRGPPLVIQSPTVDSTPLIQLDSTESEKIEDANEQTDGAWLDLADSSSSKGSQGSYADQVPALSGSGSAQDPFDVLDFQSQRAQRMIQPPELETISLEGHQNAPFSPAARSLHEMPTDEVKSPTRHSEDAVHGFLASQPSTPVHAIDSMDDILGPKEGTMTVVTQRKNMDVDSVHLLTKESVEDILGPMAKQNVNISTKESIDDILGPRIDVGPNEAHSTMHDVSDFNDRRAGSLLPPESLRGTQNEANSQFEQRTKNTQDVALECIVKSLGEYQKLQPHSARVFIGPKNLSVSRSSTYESKGSYPSSASEGLTTELSKEGSSWTDSRHPLSPASTSRNGSSSHASSYSRDGTLSVDASTYSRDGTLSPTTDAFSPTSRNESIFSSDVSHTISEGDTNTFSYEGSTTGDPSIFSGVTGYTSYTGYTDPSAFTHGTETDGSFTEHTRSTYVSSAVSNSAKGSSTTAFFSANENSGTAHSRTSLAHSIQEVSKESSSSRHSSAVGSSLMSPSAHSKSVGSPRADVGVDPLSGGTSPSQVNSQSEQHRSHFAQSLMARTRSRADTSAVLSTTSASAAGDTVVSRATMIRIGEELDEKFIVSTTIARKRVSVVQLLVVGLISLLVCLFGGVWIQSSCHYVSADVRVGDTHEVFNLHYGLWKYSPMGSAFQGYTYCDKYDKNYTVSPPYMPRIASFLASLGGTYAVCVLWLYLILGRGTRLHWNAAVRVSFLAGLLHGASLLIFISPICYEKDCELGPAGIVSLVAVAANFVLSFEMYYNSPIKSWMDDVPSCPSNEEPRMMMQTLEMADFQEGASAYCRRLVTTPSAEIPTLNQIQRQNEDPIGESLIGRGIAKGLYSPPAIV